MIVEMMVILAIQMTVETVMMAVTTVEEMVMVETVMMAVIVEEEMETLNNNIILWPHH
jgi:hypothetical protein